MHQLGNEEKAALLLAAADDDNNEPVQTSSTARHDHNPIIVKRPKTYQRRDSNGPHPMLCFAFILLAFILGSITGVIIILYRMSQDSGQLGSANANSATLTNVDITIKKKLFDSMVKTNFLNLNRSIDSEYDAANKLEQNWQSFSNIFTHVNKLSYDLTLSKYSPATQWSGIEILGQNDSQQLKKFNLLTTNDYVSYASLIKSDRIDATYIFYVNYGRQEDFAYLMKQIQFNVENNDKTILFMRRKSTVISQTEQIRQTIRHGFAGLVLFDDDEDGDSQSYQQIETTKDRQSFGEEWLRLSTDKERQKFLDGVSNEDDRQIAVLILSNTDVGNIFASDSNNWLSCPSEWHSNSKSLKLGGLLENTKLRLTTYMQEEPVRLPLVLGYIAGSIDADRFVMIGYQLGRKQQETVVNEIIKAFENPIKYGWHPRRSIIFCAWSGLSYDRYTVRRWIADNYRLVDRNLVAYIDLGHGVIGNSTINLHGSPLLQQVAQRAADAVASPLVHNHTCHHRQKQPQPMEHSHHDRRKRDEEHDHHMETDEHEEELVCEPHKLLDEWLRASNNRMGVNKSISIVQMIDTDSSAALFQLQHGIPSLLIEMTDESALNNDTFFLRKSPAVFNNEITPEVIVAYAQFVSEIIRQLIDEPLIPFNLTNYADMIDRQTTVYLARYDTAYQSLRSHLGDPSDMMKVISDLTKTIRQTQSNIDQITKNNYANIQAFNQKLMEFERLFIIDDQLRGMNTADETYKHVFIGPAFGLTNTIVPFPSLSNLLYRIANDPPTELCDASKLYWSRAKQHFQLIKRTLSGLDGLLSNSS